MHPDPWRPMTPADIATVSAIAAAVHPDYPERDVVFADRLALFPSGCWIAARDGQPLGYLLSHPYRLGAVPDLDTELGALPDRPDTYYLHDLALMPAARGAGVARMLVDRVLADIASAFPSTSLVAVGRSAPFWARFGFQPEHRPALAERLAGYDDAARYMVRMHKFAPITLGA